MAETLLNKALVPLLFLNLIMKLRTYITFCFFMLISSSLLAQGVSIADTVKIPQTYKPEFRRQLNHDKIDAEQKAILASDGTADSFFNTSKNDDVNYIVTQTLIKKVDNLQFLIESDTLFDHRLKVNYLYGLENVLKYFNITWKQNSDKKVNPSSLPLIISAYEDCIEKDRNKKSIESVISRLPYDAGNAVLGASIFDKNAGYINSKNNLVLKYCVLHPSQMLATLKENPNMPFADSLVRAIDKRKYARQLYDYSQAFNHLGSVIRNITDDKFIYSIVQMGKSKSGQQYFPFLDNIVNGKLTIAEIDEVKNDSLQYYKLLVKTQMDYAERAMNKDTAFEFASLTTRLVQKAKLSFVNVINGLHNENAEFRFRSIQPLTAEELYYLAVSSDGSIYTSSFVKGIFPLMMKKINNRGDSLLMNLHFDKYRKFIKMSAGFNMLDIFLKSFPKSNNPDVEDPASTLMRAFVKNLEKSDGIEDGVDVADSYASIAETLKPLADQMLKNIQDNFKTNLAAGNKKGIAMYNILNKLFLSADSTQNIDLTKELSIPPIYEVPYSALTYDSNNHVAVQLFIYGDRDGIGLFPSLINMFNNSNWKIDGSNKQWVTVTAAKGMPVTLYMNRPLPEETNADAEAQAALCKYLATNNIIPKVTINRGHSYNAPYTIEQMSTASKIVFMGSCGGYRSIHDILVKAPDAHIIGTKQIADAPVNNPFLKLITEKLRTGSSIDWIPFWKELGKMATDKIFDDYVPPHKNLGALFIKAYKIAMGEQDNQTN